MVQEPKKEKWILKNGVQCIAALIPNAPLTCIDLWCRAGSVLEKAGDEGLAHFLEHMIFKGSSKLKEGEFDLKVEACGGSSNAATGYDDVHFYVLIPPDKLVEAINLLTNLVLTPEINKHAFVSERDVVLEEIAQHNDQPDERIFQTLLENCWKDHRYGKSILGNEKSLRSISPEKMRLFHKKFYSSQNIVISIAGSIPNDIKDLVQNSELAEIDIASGNNDTNKTNANIFNKGNLEIEDKRLELSRLLMVWPLPPAKEVSMIIGADIVTSLLAEGRRSRLVNRLREELEIVESIDMDITPLEQGGIITLEATSLKNEVKVVEEEINNILQKTYFEEINLIELRRAKKLVTNGLCFGLETASQVAGHYGYSTLWGREDKLQNSIDIIEGWTIKDLKQKIFRTLLPENSFTVIANP